MNDVFRMSKAELERELRGFLYNYNSDAGDGGEEYKFNIRMLSARLPDQIAEKLTASQQGELLERTYQEALEMFVDEVRQNYKWVSGWRRDGRSGGWLVLETSDPIFSRYGEIPEHESEKGGPKDWSPLSTFEARKRLKDLHEIAQQLRQDKEMLIDDMKTMEFWGEEKYWNRSAR